MASGPLLPGTRGTQKDPTQLPSLRASAPSRPLRAERGAAASGPPRPCPASFPAAPWPGARCRDSSSHGRSPPGEWAAGREGAPGIDFRGGGASVSPVLPVPPPSLPQLGSPNPRALIPCFSSSPTPFALSLGRRLPWGAQTHLAVSYPEETPRRGWQAGRLCSS